MRATEPFPHTRCLAAEPEPARKWTLGALSLSREGRSLHIEGAPGLIRIAAFGGPGLANAATPALVAQIAEREPTIAVMLGGLGDDDTTASETMQAFAGAPFPTFFVPGGRDHWGRVTQLRGLQSEAVRARFIEAATLRSIRIGGHELVPVAGASDGRYAVNADSCGFALSDLQALAGDLGAPSGGRYLLAWQAPARGGRLSVAQTEAGLDLGSEALAEFAARAGAPGGLFAWPHVRIDRPVVGGGKRAAEPGQAAADLRLLVPRLTGPALVLDDGTRVPAGFAMLTLDEGGLAYLGRVEPAI